MKKAVLILGYIFLALILTTAAGFLFLVLEGKKLDRESKAFADSAVLAIAKDWDAGELRKRASVEFGHSVDYDEVQEDLDTLRSLGKFVSYRGSMGEANITLSPRYGYEITAEYAGTVNCETGTAEVQVVLILLEGRWQILDFNVVPQEFTEDKYVV